MRKEVIHAAAALVAVTCTAAALTAQTPEPPEPFAVTFEKIQADLRERLSDYPQAPRNPDNPDIFGDAGLMRRELVEQVETAYEQDNLPVLRRMNGAESGSATDLRRAVLNRIEDAYGRDDLPLLKRMVIEERGWVLVDLARQRFQRFRDGKPNEPLTRIPWFLEPPETNASAEPQPPMRLDQAAGDRGKKQECTRNSHCRRGSICGQDGVCERKPKRRPERPRPAPPDLTDVPKIYRPGGVRCTPRGWGDQAVCAELREDHTNVLRTIQRLGCSAIYDPRTGQTTVSGGPECEEAYALLAELGRDFACGGCETAPPPDDGLPEMPTTPPTP